MIFHFNYSITYSDSVIEFLLCGECIVLRTLYVVGLQEGRIVQ